MALETFPEQFPGIFRDIMMMVGLDRPDTLHKCRQVCKRWNEKISQDILGKENKKMILRERTQRNWGPERFPSGEEISRAKMLGDDCFVCLILQISFWILEDGGYLDPGMIQSLIERVKSSLRGGSVSGGDVTTVMCGASLSHHGLLGSLSRMMLCDVDLSQVPDKDLVSLASLASCVTGDLRIRNVTGGQQIATLLTNLKCNRLLISRQSLGQGETRALVQAMESSVEEVWLWEVSLEREALSEYSGQGVCREVSLWNDTAARYKEELKQWAGNRNWRVTKDTDEMFYVERK